MKYSERFREKMVQKMTGPGAMSAARLSKECGVGQPTLSSWLRGAKVLPMTPKRKVGRPRRWAQAEKLRVVLSAAAVGEAGLGELLRREGLHEAELRGFQEEVAAAMSDKVPKSDAADKQRIKDLERELYRKERALAEAAALLVLRKKLSAYFSEGEVGDTDGESEK
jgi:transposase-like protein